MDASFEAQVLETLAVDVAAAPLLLAEVRVVACFELPAILLVCNAHHMDFGGNGAITSLDHALLALPAYIAFAEADLKQAAAHVRDIHAFAVPYASYKAFSLDESAVIGRLARIALARDEHWVSPCWTSCFAR